MSPPLPLARLTRRALLLPPCPGGAPSRPPPGPRAGFRAIPQGKRDQALVAQDAAELGAQVAVEAFVVVQPPERRPGKDEITRPRRPQALQLLERRGVVLRVAPVLAPP